MSILDKDMQNIQLEESEYLDNLISKINVRLAEIEDAVISRKNEIDYINNHLQEHKRDMDHLEKNALKESVHNFSLMGEHSLLAKKRMLRLKDIAYFGRIDLDFLDTIYVGVHNFIDTEINKNLVYDWRAPISTLFYDYELGPASYQSPNGVVDCNVVLKRQFRIRGGKMDYMIDTDLAIHDDVLQKELNRSSSAKMKNIVATIQKEQNSIIRDVESKNLVIQGVAGSGKTSVALHRIAFLLYRYKESITSDDILIISPNKVFANYISNVLPELGEESVAETSLEEIANRLFDYNIKFESFFDQVSYVLENQNSEYVERVKFKSSLELIHKMDKYLLYLENEGFRVIDIEIKGKHVPAWFIKESFQKHSRLPILKRFNKVVEDIVYNVSNFYGYQIEGKDRQNLHSQIRKMFPSVNLKALYKNFYVWMERSDLFKQKRGSIYEYSDIFPLLYLKMKLEGITPFYNIKHLVIDEMQDYSVVQYRVLNALFLCDKTILGDINQTVNPFSSSDIDTINSVFSNSKTITINKSYRSTYEITKFSSEIGGKHNIEALERHGAQPEVIKCASFNNQILKIEELIESFKKESYNSLAIICKTQKQADVIYDRLSEKNDNIGLLNSQSVSFGTGVVVTWAHMAKGLEFDAVIVPDFCNNNYKTHIDYQMLYVACTRAMHRLWLTGC